jgi:glycosyltransferase involved in cell wall biosynthesis
MKIGIDCRLWSETGVGRYIRNLIKNLQVVDGKNNYVLFVLSKDYENVKCQMSNVKWKIVETDIKWHSFEEQLEFPIILKRENLDLMHFPYPSIPVFYNRPFIITIHDLIVNHFPTGLASTLPLPIYYFKLLGYKFILKRAAKNAKKIIAVSNATKNEIIDHLKIDTEKIDVIHEGVDNKLSGNWKLEIGNWKLKNLPSKFFLYVGNAYPHKNLERLLQALNILISEYPNISLICIGKEDYFYKRLSSKVQSMKLSGKVIFLQNVSDEELSNLYQNALALILPSLMEGFGLTVLEAMANKCLVLASNIPSLQEVCGDNAIYFNPYSIKDMAKKIKEVYSNDTYYYSDKKEKGLERVKLFSWEKMAKETLKVYEDVIG